VLAIYYHFALPSDLGCKIQVGRPDVLTQIADGVLVHTSEFLQSNAVVVQGQAGVLLIDPGVTESEIDCLANDLRELGQPVVAGFSTHPHWDHMLWHTVLGAVPRYATARCAATAHERLSGPDAKARVAGVLPPDIADQIPLDLLGALTGLPTDAVEIPWEGPRARILEHQAHAAGHAALLIEGSGVLVAGDMLSDVLVPMLDRTSPADPVEAYLSALTLLDSVADQVTVVVPGHGSVGTAQDVRERIDRDRTYVTAVHNGDEVTDARFGAAR